MKNWTLTISMAMFAVSTPACGQIDLDPHGKQMETERAGLEALNGPGGADYPRAIAILEQSGRSRSLVNYQVGNVILSAYRDPSGVRVMPRERVSDGVARLEAAASGGDASADPAASALARWYRHGAGAALVPDAALASCWERVRAHRDTAAACIEHRRAGG